MVMQRTFAVIVLLLALAFTGGCGGKDKNKDVKVTALNGAGATFPYPFYSKAFAMYSKETGVRVNYQSIGSGAGQKQLFQQVVDFGGSDAPLSDEQMQEHPGVLHIPTVLGAVTVTYNLEGVADLRLTPELLADIFLGKIKKWNDPRLAAANPGAKLSAKDVTVAHRSDGSGTTYVFTDYLSAVSGEWKDEVGKGTSVRWPVGLGGKGNEGVTAIVKQTPGAIGYVELIYVEQNKLPHALLKNRAGEFVRASLDSVTAAAASVAANMPDDLRVSIVNVPSKGSYPISSFTYLLVYRDQGDEAKGRAVTDLLWWVIHDGEKYARDLTYAPLPPEVVARAEEKVRSISYQGKSLLNR